MVGWMGRLAALAYLLFYVGALALRFSFGRFPTLRFSFAEWF